MNSKTGASVKVWKADTGAATGEEQRAAIPEFVGEIYFEDGVSAVAASHDGSTIAVGSKGLLGVYRLERSSGDRLVHVGSYVVPDGADVANICFSGSGSRLSIMTSDGRQRELTLSVRVEGMLQEAQAAEIL